MGQALPEPDAGHESEIEIRQVFEAEDFGAEFTPELREQEERLRAADGTRTEYSDTDREDRTMRFMMLMIPKGYETGAPGTMPDAEAVAAMMKYNESLQKAGVLLALDGLHPPSMGARVIVRRRQAEGHRRAVRRSEGSARRLLDDPGEVEGGGDRVGEALPGVATNEIIEVRQVQEIGGLSRRRAGGAPAGLRRSMGRDESCNGRARTMVVIWRPVTQDAPTRIARSTRSGGSSRRAGSIAGLARSCATSAWPRTWRRTRWSPRSSSGRRPGVPRQPGRLAHGHRQAPRASITSAATSCSSASTRSSGYELEARAGRRPTPDLDAALDDDVGDDLLRLIFTACHPVLSTEARVALTLRLLGGLTTDEIARAFLVAGADHRAAHRPRQAHAGRGAGALRGARAAPSWPRGSRRCSRSST